MTAAKANPAVEQFPELKTGLMNCVPCQVQEVGGAAVFESLANSLTFSSSDVSLLGGPLPIKFRLSILDKSEN